MIFTEKSVFLELAKTGSTYARYILLQMPGSENVGKKHNIFSQLKPKNRERFSQSIKVASIRNPFEYYVSLYGFACSKRGGLYTRVMKRPDYLSFYHPGHLFTMTVAFLRWRSEWRKVLQDANSIENFKRFLYLLLEQNPTGAGFHYGLCSAYRYIGYYTHDYLRTCTYDFIPSVGSFSSFADFEEHQQEKYFVDVMLRNESMRNDLLDRASDIGFSRDMVKAAIDNKPARSKTSSKHRPWQEYYDAETKKLVEEKERLIIEKFNYRFE